MENQLVRSQKLASLGLLLSGIVHEIKNFNNCITFNVPILGEYLKELIPIIDDYAEGQNDLELFGMSYPAFREDIFKLLHNLEHASDQISATVSSLGDFVTRSENNKKQWVELKRVIERGIAICGYQLKRKVKSFEVDIAEDLPRVLTFPGALEQVLVNLLVNASQAVDKEDSWVKLKVKRGKPCGDDVVIEVRDNGCGMDEGTRGKVFKPFFTTKAADRGTGLGLFVSHYLIRRLGGRIEVESKQGGGTTFRVILNTANPKPRKTTHGLHSEALLRARTSKE